MLYQIPVRETGRPVRNLQTLRAHEIELRKCFTDDCADDLLLDSDYNVEVRFQKRCVLARERLPQNILDDPQYFDVKYTPVVRVVPRTSLSVPGNTKRLTAWN